MYGLSTYEHSTLNVVKLCIDHPLKQKVSLIITLSIASKFVTTIKFSGSGSDYSSSQLLPLRK